MHYVVVIAVAVTLSFTAGCSSGNKETAKEHETTTAQEPAQAEPPAAKISGAMADSLLQKLCKTWYSKKLVLHDLQEEYPTNNEELILRRDMSYSAVDRVEEDSLAGTWQITRSDVIMLTAEPTGESHSFRLTELTDEVLVTKVLDTEEENISIHYGAKP